MATSVFASAVAIATTTAMSGAVAMSTSGAQAIINSPCLPSIVPGRRHGSLAWIFYTYLL
jgi:hypothetical protein